MSRPNHATTLSGTKRIRPGGGIVAFDSAVYKETTKQPWEEAAEAWHSWGPTLEEWLGEATESMLDAGFVGPCALDVLSGTR
jgi:hypothetical protein